MDEAAYCNTKATSARLQSEDERKSRGHVPLEPARLTSAATSRPLQQSAPASYRARAGGVRVAKLAPAPSEAFVPSGGTAGIYGADFGMPGEDVQRRSKKEICCCI